MKTMDKFYNFRKINSIANQRTPIQPSNKLANQMNSSLISNLLGPKYHYNLLTTSSIKIPSNVLKNKPSSSAGQTIGIATKFLTSSYTQQKEVCDGNVKMKKVAKYGVRSIFGGGGKSGGFKWTIMKLSLSVGAIYTTYKLNFWGTPDDSVKLVQSIQQMLNIPQQKVMDSTFGMMAIRKYNESIKYVESQYNKLPDVSINSMKNYFASINVSENLSKIKDMIKFRKNDD